MGVHEHTMELVFRRDRSARYAFAVNLARQFPSYSQSVDEDGVCHSVRLDGEANRHEAFVRFISLLKTVQNWHGTTLVANGEPMPAAAVERVLHVGECYQRQRRAGNSHHYCNAFDPRHSPTAFGCRQLVEVNRYVPRAGAERQSENAWYRFGELQGMIYRVDKGRIAGTLLGEAERKLVGVCPAFDADAVRKEIESLPDEIDIAEDHRWAVESRTDGRRGIRMKTVGAKGIDDRLLANGGNGSGDGNGNGEKSQSAVEGSDARIVPDIRFADVCGQDRAVTAVRDWIELPLKHAELFRHVGVPTKVGILLHGPPGTGKTLLAQAVAGECQAHLEMISGPEILSKWVGQSEETLRSIFERAKRHAPSVVLLDEVDAIAPKRDRAMHGHEVTLVSQLLTLLDGLFDRGQVVVIATTNRLDAVDPALRRSGRFDYAIEMAMPDTDGRQSIFDRHLARMAVAPSIDSRWLAEITPRLTGADIARICRQAGLVCIKDAVSRGLGPNDGVLIDLRHMIGALDELGYSHVAPVMNVGS